jgi:hypothetical protein
MRKTISLKLTPDEERIVDLIHGRGVSHSILLRDALRHYFNLVDQAVDHFTGEAVNQKVDPVNRNVNPVDRTDNYLALYIEQLNTRMHQLENETQEWKTKHAAEVQYLKDSYNLLQTEYHNQVKDSIKRIDEKFDRIMFYLEESRKPIMQAVDMKSESKAKSDSIVGDVLKVENKRDTEKPKKGWVLKMYRM